MTPQTITPTPHADAVRAALAAAPIVDDTELDQLLARHMGDLARIFDYLIDKRLTLIDIRQLVIAHLGTDEGRTDLVALFINDPYFTQELNQYIDARIRVARPRRDRWHVPQLFSWLGALIGAGVGLVLGLVLNVLLDPTPTETLRVGEQPTFGPGIDMLGTQSVIVIIVVLISTAVGGVLGYRRDS